MIVVPAVGERYTFFGSIAIPSITVTLNIVFLSILFLLLFYKFLGGNLVYNVIPAVEFGRYDEDYVERLDD